MGWHGRGGGRLGGAGRGSGRVGRGGHHCVPRKGEWRGGIGEDEQLSHGRCLWGRGCQWW
jgi:hypothetical protein